MLLTCLALALAVADDPIGPTHSPDGRYTVHFPKPPKTEAKELAVGNGVTVPVVTAKADGPDKLVYAVVYADYPPEFRDVPADKLLAGARDGLKGKDGVLVRNQPTTFGEDKLPAREVTVEAGRGARYAVRAVLVLSGTRLYQVMVTGPKDAIGKKSADEFIRSFKLDR
ncbi:MAG: hypothetical protein U0871_12995 [Gemmataceae bacterium]